MKDNYKDVLGYEGIYIASNQGIVLSSHHNKHNGWHPLKQSKDKKGYLRISLHKDGVKTDQKFSHRLIAELFVPNPENKPFINHKNAIKSDNRADNLEWVTTQENNYHARSLNLIPALIGEKNGRSKINEKDVLEIRRLYLSGIHYKEIQKSYPVNSTTIHKIVKHKLWNHVK